MKYLLIIFVFASCGPSIRQKSQACDPYRFRVYTEIRKTMNKSDSIYWNFSDCITIEQIDSVKNVEYAKAEIVLENFNKIK